MKALMLCALRVAIASLLLTSIASGQTGMTYQGMLKDGSKPATGVYDFQFALFGAASGGSQLIAVVAEDVTVSNGLFTVELLGLEPYFSGSVRYIEVRVRLGNSVGPYTTLMPRSAITHTPYASFAFAPWKTLGSIVYYDGGRVGIGDGSPLATFTVGSGDKFQVDGTRGSLYLSDDLASITFPATQAPNAPMIQMFDDGTMNADRMVLAHSANEPILGMMYRDRDDSFHFVSGGTSKTAFDILHGYVGIGQMEPHFPLHFASQLGNKIALWGDSGPHYGLGVQSNLLQIYTNNAGSDIAFGYGDSGSFTEIARIKNTGSLLVGTSSLADVCIGALTSAGTGVYGRTSSGSQYAGVWGYSSSNSGNGVVGYVNGSGTAYAVWGQAVGGGASFAGMFNGRVHVVGSLTATGTKPFRIDHPKDPLNKYLYHYAMESPEVLNVYRGSVVLDGSGRATVELPDYFEDINIGFEYTLTAVGAAMPNLHVSREIAGRSFGIAGGAAGKKVSWMVTARRNDLFVRERGAPIEEDKPEELRGAYQDAELYGLPAGESEAFRRDAPVER